MINLTFSNFFRVMMNKNCVLLLVGYTIVIVFESPNWKYFKQTINQKGFSNQSNIAHPLNL